MIITAGIDIPAVLKQNSLFEAVAQADLERFARHCTLQTLDKRETLFLQGDTVDRFYLVISGLVKVYRLDPAGQRQVVLHLDGPGMFVAAVAAFLQEPRFPASAETVERSQVLELPLEAFFRLVEANPLICKQILRFTAQRTRQIVHLLDSLLFQELDSRLARYLLQTLECQGQGFKLPTNSELAALLGTTSEPVSRKLGQFVQQGWIQMQQRKIHIADIEALSQLNS